MGFEHIFDDLESCFIFLHILTFIFIIFFATIFKKSIFL